jgi:small subunit ribosomal protein S3
VPRILIERAANRCRITILTARPGVVIGRKGAEIDKLKEELSKMTGKEVYVDIVEVKTPESTRNWSRKTSPCSWNAACRSAAR